MSDPEIIVGITGVTGGIGQALKIACERRGDHVVGFSRNPKAGEVSLDHREAEVVIPTVIKKTAERVGRFTVRGFGRSPFRSLLSSALRPRACFRSSS